MLILSRRPGESIVINKDIRITYLGNNRCTQARIGIEAPKEISVHREEIQERINNGEKFTKETCDHEHE